MTSMSSLYWTHLCTNCIRIRIALSSIDLLSLLFAEPKKKGGKVLDGAVDASAQQLRFITDAAKGVEECVKQTCDIMKELQDDVSVFASEDEETRYHVVWCHQNTQQYYCSGCLVAAIARCVGSLCGAGNTYHLDQCCYFWLISDTDWWSWYLGAIST